MIVDCGGGTIDLSTYRVVDNQPISVEETVVPDCTCTEPLWFVIALTSGGRPDSGIDDGEPSSRGVTEEYIAPSPDSVRG